MNKSYLEIRTLSERKVRKLCIDHDWYTLGSNEDYAHLLLDIIPGIGNVTTADLAEIATNIKEHSDTEQSLTSIMYELARVCESFFTEIQST